MNTVLFVSIAFPPKADAEGLQVAKYLKYLLREGKSRFDIDVVTSPHPTLNMTYDASLEAVAEGVRQKIEVPIYENRYSNFLLRKVAPWLVQSPDSKFSFHWQADRVAQQLHNPPSLIYSRAFPLSSSVMACKLKKRFNVPWIMHLSDPWADCPLTKFEGRAMQYNQKAEKMCFEAADVICLTSESTIDYYRKKYSHLGKRFEFFPNVFDSEDIMLSDNRAPERSNKFRIVYTGSMTGDRSAESFLAAISSLPEEKQDELEVIIIGDVDRRNAMVLDRYRAEYLICHGPMEYQKALEYQRSADVLLLIDMPVEEPELRMFFLSKILDYMIARKPILALVDQGSETDSVIRKHALGTCIERHDTEGIRKHLLWLLSSRDSDYFNEREILPEYDAAYNAERLIGLFNEFLQVQSAGSGRAGVR